MIFFTSDLHFGHANSINLCARPYKSVEEMNHTLITNWNSVVNDNDEVYILGDISMTKKWAVVYEYLKQLQGKKYLIRGNHDHFIKDPHFMKHYFELIADYHELKYNGNLFILSHYPMFDWKMKFRGSIHLYGHIHAKDSLFLQEQFGHCYHVGVDSNDYKPVSAEEIIERMQNVPKTGFVDEAYSEVKVGVWHQASKTEEDAD